MKDRTLLQIGTPIIFTSLSNTKTGPGWGSSMAEIPMGKPITISKMLAVPYDGRARMLAVPYDGRARLGFKEYPDVGEVLADGYLTYIYDIRDIEIATIDLVSSFKRSF